MGVGDSGRGWQHRSGKGWDAASDAASDVVKSLRRDGPRRFHAEDGRASTEADAPTTMPAPAAEVAPATSRDVRRDERLWTCDTSDRRRADRHQLCDDGFRQNVGRIEKNFFRLGRIQLSRSLSPCARSCAGTRWPMTAATACCGTRPTTPISVRGSGRAKAMRCVARPLRA